jgi:hypothetical protein
MMKIKYNKLLQYQNQAPLTKIYLNRIFKIFKYRINLIPNSWIKYQIETQAKMTKNKNLRNKILIIIRKVYIKEEPFQSIKI